MQFAKKLEDPCEWNKHFWDTWSPFGSGCKMPLEGFSMQWGSDTVTSTGDVNTGGAVRLQHGYFSHFCNSDNL